MHMRKTIVRLPYHWLMPLAFFCIGLIYLYVTPHFEGSDNVAHFGVIKWIADNGTLPVQSAEHDELYEHEAGQPPLYYLLMAPIWANFDTTDFDDYFQRNPLVYKGDPERLGNRNLVFYRQPHAPLLQGTSLALYVIRLLTLGMATVTVAAVYQSARTLLPHQPQFAILATSLTAFNPMFIFVSASVSNDVLVTALASLACWQALAMLREGFRTRRSITLAALIACATLSKLSGLVLAPAVLLAGLWILMRHGDRRGFIILVSAVTIACLLLTGWWFLRNLSLYGELFGTNTLLDYFGRRSISVQRLFTEEFEGLRINFWGLFGAFSILTDRIHYILMDALSLAAFAGFFIILRRKRKDLVLMSSIAFLTTFLALGAVIVIWWSLQTTSSAGRLLFPYITSISILMALGLHAWRIPVFAIAAPMFLFAVAAPSLYIFPAYDHPPQLAKLPTAASQTYARWGDIALVGYELPLPRRWTAGDEMPVTLYWQPQAQSETMKALFITLIDADGEALATIDSFPGWGTLPTTWWAPGKIYRDDYILQIPQDAAAYSTVGLHIGWYDWASGVNIMPTREADVESKPFILPVGAFVGNDSGEALAEGATPAGLVFGDVIRLKRFRFVDGHALELEWELLREMSGDWRVFAHALAEPYQVNAPVETGLQKDSSPAVPLDYLEVGEAFITRHDFDLPAGYRKSHEIYVGWYNDDIIARLEIPQEDNMLLIGEFDFYD